MSSVKAGTTIIVSDILTHDASQLTDISTEDFHYGYWIYAAAVIAKEDKEWGSKYSDFILDLIRDIANPSDDDNYFPVTRHKDWYLGHSWASGLFEFGGTFSKLKISFS